MTAAQGRRTTDERFDAKLIRSDTGCLEWQGALSRHSKNPSLGGYGMFRDGARIVYAHRYALERALGRPIRPGYEADHMCHNRRCCNEDHLRELSKRENFMDAIARSRLAPAVA